MNRPRFDAAVLALALACGGGGAPISTYGPPQPPSTPESQAANIASSNLSTVFELKTTSDAATADRDVLYLVGLGLTMADSLILASSSRGPAGAGAAEISVASGAAARTRAAWIDPACVTLTASRLTYSHCTRPSGVITDTADGSLARNGETLSWDISLSSSVADGSTSYTNTRHYTGSVTITGNTIKGATRADLTVTGTASGQRVDNARAATLDLDLDYQAPSSCIARGTLELKSLTTQRPANGPGFPDAGYKFIWSGGSCPATLQVAHSKT